MNKKQLMITLYLIIVVLFLIIDQTAYAGRSYARWNPILNALGQAMQSGGSSQVVQQQYGGACSSCSKIYVLTPDNFNYANVQCPYCGNVESVQGVLQRYRESIEIKNTQSAQQKSRNNKEEDVYRCPTCDSAMYFTGETKTEWGKTFGVYKCASGHLYWFEVFGRQSSGSFGTDNANRRDSITSSKCPICGMGTSFTGKTYTEWGNLFEIYECPSGHQSVKKMGN